MIQAIEILKTSYYVYQVFILWIATSSDFEKYNCQVILFFVFIVKGTPNTCHIHIIVIEYISTSKF